MNNSFVRIVISGKNVNSYLKRLIKLNINIKNITYISPKEISIIISFKDYLKLNTKNTIYKIRVVKYYGKKACLNIINKNKFVLIFLILNVCFVIFLSNIIFSVEVIHPKKEIRELTLNNLKSYGLIKYRLVKSSDEIKQIEANILKENSDKIEWLEIKRLGTKYVINIEERIINKSKKDSRIKSIVASKNAILMDIYATSGEKVKNIGSYVTLGDEIISPYITKPDNSLVQSSASGKVFGEVWYNVYIDFPYFYKEEKLTGNSKNVYIINFLGKNITFPFYKKYKDFEASNVVILKNNLLPIAVLKQHQYEVNIISNYYNESNIEKYAAMIAKEKLLNQNKKIVSIISSKVLTREDYGSYVKLKIFFKVKEDITMVKYVESNN